MPPFAFGAEELPSPPAPSALHFAASACLVCLVGFCSFAELWEMEPTVCDTKEPPKDEPPYKKGASQTYPRSGKDTPRLTPQNPGFEWAAFQTATCLPTRLWRCFKLDDYAMGKFGAMSPRLLQSAPFKSLFFPGSKGSLRLQEQWVAFRDASSGFSHLAVGQHQWYHFGEGAPPILVYFSGDWDVHWGYGVLTHSHLCVCF